jgi:hypothetical protein
MVTAAGEPVLLDFNLARAAAGEHEQLTLSGDPVGTPAYMAPEQVHGRPQDIDRRTDVYALGVVLFECLTLRLPFEAPDRESLYREILGREAPSPRRFDRRIERELCVVLATALAKEPSRRYQTAQAFAEDLARLRDRKLIQARRAGVVLRRTSDPPARGARRELTNKASPRPLHVRSNRAPGTFVPVRNLPQVTNGIRLPDGRHLPFLNGMTWCPPIPRPGSGTGAAGRRPLGRRRGVRVVDARRRVGNDLALQAGCGQPAGAEPDRVLGSGWRAHGAGTQRARGAGEVSAACATGQRRFEGMRARREPAIVVASRNREPDTAREQRHLDLKQRLDKMSMCA